MKTLKITIDTNKTDSFYYTGLSPGSTISCFVA